MSVMFTWMALANRLAGEEKRLGLVGTAVLLNMIHIITVVTFFLLLSCY
jgi:hypothetical protein